jgi:hypothetical protein
MSLKLNSSGGGSVTLQEPVTASARTLSLPDATATLLANNGPFTANASASAGAVTIDASNNVGIGTTLPGYKLVLESASNFAIHLLKTSSNDGWVRNIGNLDIAAASGGSGGQVISFSIGANFAGLTEAARFDGNRNFLLNKTSTAASGSGVCFQTNDTSQFYRGGDGQTIQFFRSSTQVGNISVTGTATAYNTSSDYRLKEAVVPMTGALAKVEALKPVTYKWKADGSEGEGFIAHELAEVVPGCVTGEKDATETVEIKDEEGNVTGTEVRPVYQGIDTSFLVATLTAAIQEQQALITGLTARIAALEAK